MTAPPVSRAAVVARVVLGLFLLGAGIGHLTVARVSFRAQVPPWVPLPVDVVVLASGVVEIVLGLALLVLVRWRVPVGWVVAAFFVVIFPGNISQLVEQPSPVLVIRLFFQPLLVLWALWSTGAWKWWRQR